MDFRALLKQQQEFLFENLGQDAILLGPFPDRKIRVLRGKERAEGSLFGQSTESDIGLFRIMVSEAPEMEKGYRIVLDGETFVVKGTPQKITRNLVWEVEAPPDD